MASPVTKPSPSGKRAPTSGLAGLMANKAKTNMQRIQDAAAGNMELQTLLCEIIDNYEKEKETGEFQLLKKKRKRAPTARLTTAA